MIAIVLAGGYGTRLQTISRNTAKALLKVNGEPMVGHIFSKLTEIEEIRQVIISTNLRFQEQFKEWLGPNPRRVEIVADPSRSEEEKPGAIASLAKLVSQMGDDCLIIAGDNLFTSNLKEMFRTFKEKSCATLALYDVKDCSLAKQYSAVTIDEDGRILSFSEKPSNPKTTLVGTCIYMFPKRTLSRLTEYLTEAVDRDRPGGFIEWLCGLEPVYGHVLDGYWCDIGTVDQYHEANQILYVDRILSPSFLGGGRHEVCTLRDLMPVLYDAPSCSNIRPKLPVYEVYRDACGDAERDILLKYGLRYDVILMPPMKLGSEYVKTVGDTDTPSRDGASHPKVLEVLEGEGRFLIQKYEDQKVIDVRMVTAEAGDKVLVPPNCGVVVINTSSSRLVVGSLASRFCVQTHGPFVERRGAAYHLLEGGRLVRNVNYTSVPDIRLVDAERSLFEKYSGVLVSLLDRPEQFTLLNLPSKSERAAEEIMVEARTPG